VTSALRLSLSLRNKVLLIGLWLFITAFNLDKAYHVDDTAYLEMARWILENPLRPMSGILSWGSDYQPIHYTNQPPLYFYLMAGWGWVFGWEEISMHALMSVFTFWAVFAFHRLARIVTPGASILPTILLAFSPVFVYGQNTMVDIPLLAVWLEFFRVLLDPKIDNKWRYLLSGTLLGLAMLVKYSSLALLPILFMHIVFVGGARRLFWILLPVGVMASWCGFNYWEYGGIHMMGRPVASRSLSTYVQSSLYWISALGAILPFAGLYFYGYHRLIQSPLFKLVWQLIVALLCSSYVFFGIWLAAHPEKHLVNLVLQISFLVSGTGLVVLLMVIGVEKARLKTLNSIEWILLSWFAAAAGFIIVLAPFIAARHVLFALPPLILLLNRWVLVRVDTKYVTALAVLTTLVISCLIAVADRWYADIYRVQAQAIRSMLPANSVVWFNGNWGWQWYAEKANMRMLSNIPDRLSPSVGDYFVATNNVCCALSPPYSLQLERINTISIGRETIIQRLASISLYASNWQVWGYSVSPIEKFEISRVVKNKSAN